LNDVDGCPGIVIEIPPQPKECDLSSLEEDNSVCYGWLEDMPETPGPTIKPPVDKNCTAASFENDSEACLGELVEFTDDCTEASFDTENIECLGELVDFTDNCTEASFDTENIECLGELIRTEIITPPPPLEQCTKDSFKTNNTACKGELRFIGGPPVTTTTTTTTTYKPPVSPSLPKGLCTGEGSFKTVYGQRCKKNDDDGESSCTMGSEGFSFCDTEHLWWRDNHWYDWDLCSLCSNGKGPLTTSGWECKGECHNRWDNNESPAPRCEVANGGKGAPSKDYCTTCEGQGCPDEVSNPSDKRPGNQVGQIEWQVSPVE